MVDALACRVATIWSSLRRGVARIGYFGPWRRAATRHSSPWRRAAIRCLSRWRDAAMHCSVVALRASKLRPAVRVRGSAVTAAWTQQAYPFDTVVCNEATDLVRGRRSAKSLSIRIRPSRYPVDVPAREHWQSGRPVGSDRFRRTHRDGLWQIAADRGRSAAGCGVLQQIAMDRGRLRRSVLRQLESGVYSPGAAGAICSRPTSAVRARRDVHPFLEDVAFGAGIIEL